MELDALKFTVETTALDDAITKVGTLQLAVKKLGSETVAPKVIKADNIVSKDAEERVTKLNNVLERQQDILAFMASGFSKGQASVLAFGKTAGLATDQLKLLGDVLDTQRKLIGGDTFDKSNSALKALQNQYALLKDAARAYNDESSLTQKQLQGLGLDKERLLEKYKIEGKSLSDIKSALRDLNTEYNKAAISVNQQVAANTKLAESSRKTAAGQELANKALAKADEMLAKLQNRTKEMSKESPVSATAANQLYAYEKALRAAGVGADEATARLSVFRAEQQKVSQLARTEETLRMQHLSRALAPQVTDVTVGLMTGQNPFTVFLQQGGQIRDQIGLSQVAVENLGKVFKDTFVMMGAMVVAMGKAIYAFFATPVGAAVLALSALALGIYKAAGAMLEAERSTLVLNKALELNASNIGKTISSMQNLSAEVSSVSTITNTQASTAISELSKTSSIADENFVKATISAINFERYAGVAVSETVSMYKEIGKDPIKALLKLQEETGRLNVIQVEHIETLIKQGEKEKAAAELSKYMADSQANSADRIKESLTGMSRAVDKAHDDFIAFGKWFSKPFETKTLETLLKEAEDKLFTSLQNQQKMKRLFGFSFGTEKEQAAVDVLAGSVAFNNALSSQKKLQKERTDGEAALLALRLKYADKVDSREAARTEAKLALEKRLTGSTDMTPEDIARATESYGKTLELINRKEKKPKEESTEAFSINLSNELQQYEKQYGIEIKLQDDFIRQEKARLDNALAAKEITQGEFNARDLAASERGYTDRQSLSDKYYSGIISANEKNISEMVQQYQAWVNQEGGTPKFFEQNEKAVETLRSKIINTNNETSVFLEKIQASAASAKENAFTRYSKQLSTLQGEIRGVTLAYDEYLQSEANLTKQKQAQVALEDKVRFATPEQALAIKAAADETERLTKQVQDYDKQIRASKMSLDASVDIYLEQVSLTGEVTEQTQTLLNKEIERYDLLVKTKGLIESTVSTKVADAASAATTKYQKDQMKALSDSVAGALEEGLYKGGAEGAKSLRNIIEAELRKPITVFIKAVVGDIFSGVTSGSSGSSSGGTGGMSGGTGMLSELSSMYDAYSKGFAGIGTGVTNAFGSFATSSAGQALGMSTVQQLPVPYATGEMGAVITPGASSAGSALGTGASIAGGVVAGYSLGNLISGDKGQKANVNAGTLVGLLASGGNPIGAAIGGAIGGIVNAAFGKGSLEMTGAGTRGTFSTSGFQGQNYQNYKREGGWFSSDENTTDISAVPDATVKSWSTAFSTLKKSMTDSVEVLGLSAESFKNYSKYVDVAAGTTKEGLTALFTGMADEMVQGLLGTVETVTTRTSTWLSGFSSDFDKVTTTSIWHPSEFVKEGETASQTITRLSTSLKEVNTWFSFLGNTLLEVSLKGGDTASKLADVFGGLDKFSSAVSTYYNAFYSEQERAQRSSLDMAKALALVGLEMPKTKEAYRELVTEASKKLDTEPLRETYALLLTLAPEFANVADAMDKASKAATEAANTSVDTAMKVLSKAVATEKTKLQDEYNNSLSNLNTQLTSVTSSIGKLTTLAGSLKSTLDNMRILGSEGDYRVQAQYQIQQALNTARSGGGLPLNGELTSALATVSKPSEHLFGSFEDYARDFYRTANDISDLNDITVKQLSNEDQIRISLEKQIKVLTEGFDAENLRLDGILTKAQEQVDQLLNANTTLVSIELAISRLAAALLDAQKLKFSSVPSSVDAYIASSKGSTVNPVAATPVTSREQDIVKLYSDLLGRQADIGGLKDYASSTLSLDSIKASISGSAEAQARALGVDVQNKFNDLVNQQLGYTNTIKSFAVGTNFVPNDMLANIHKGERIIPAADNNLLLQRLSSPQGDNSELKEELKDMKLLLKAALDKIADNTKQSADLLDAVTAGGNAMLTELA